MQKKKSFKKILIALPNDTLGGAEQYLKMVAGFHKDRGNEVYVLFLKKKKDNGWSDFQFAENAHLYYTTADSEKRGLFEFTKTLLTLRRQKFDYVFTSHVHLTGIIGMFIKLRIIKKQYFIGRESTLIFHRFKGVKLFGFKLQYKIGYDALDILICQTSLMRSHLVKFLPRLNEKINIQVIPNPVNVSNIKSQHGATPEFNFADGDYIVSAGRLIPEKGFDILISVFAEVKKIYPGLKLLLLGEGKDRTSLTTQIEHLGLQDSVALPGFVSNVYPYFNRAKLCVVSSRIEGFPNVLLQMMSQNDKVVSTTCAGDIDAIPGLFLSETHNEESLYKAIIKSLEADTGANRKIFDEFLDERSIESFMDKIDNQLANA